MTLPLTIWRKVWVIKNNKSEKNDGEKEAECLDGTSPEEMEEYVSDINDDNIEKNASKKRLNA